MHCIEIMAVFLFHSHFKCIHLHRYQFKKKTRRNRFDNQIQFHNQFPSKLHLKTAHFFLHCHKIILFLSIEKKTEYKCELLIHPRFQLLLLVSSNYNSIQHASLNHINQNPVPQPVTSTKIVHRTGISTMLKPITFQQKFK